MILARNPYILESPIPTVLISEIQCSEAWFKKNIMVFCRGGLLICTNCNFYKNCKGDVRTQKTWPAKLSGNWLADPPH